MKIFKSFFGKKLQAALDASGRTQSWLADQIGVQSSAVSRWANGKDLPEEGRIIQIQAKLGLSDGYFDPSNNSSGGPISFSEAAEIIEKLEGLPPLHRQVVLSLIYKNPDLIELESDSVSARLQALLKVL